MTAMPLAGPARVRPRQMSRASAGQVGQPAAAEPLSEAVALLGEVMSRMTAGALPVVQFLAASPADQPCEVARDFAIAAVARFGRTLLVAGGREPCPEPAPALANWRVPDRARSKAGGLTPDTLVPGLYHMRMQGGAAEAIRLAQDSQAAWAAASVDFRMVAIESACASLCPESLLICPACRGVILTVEAGRTRLADVHSAARLVRNAGGELLGLVLTDAPDLGKLRTAGMRRRWRMQA